MKSGMNSMKVGVLGGGQLGRMFLRQANDIDLNISILDPNDDAPCASITNNFHCGDFTDYETVLNFGRKNDIITIEIENVNTAALKTLRDEGKTVRPDPDFIEIIQDKGLQKQFLYDNKISTPPFYVVENLEKLKERKHSYPVVQKLRTGGYDGKGVQILNSSSDIGKAFDAPSVIEEKVNIQQELAIQVSRDGKGRISLFPPVGMAFHEEANLLDYLYAPANLSPGIKQKMEKTAIEIAQKAELTGILAIEFFLDKNNELWVNEMAPRPHNSGHHTLQANYTSQYGQLVRSLLDLPPGETSLHHSAVMVNLLGEPGYEGTAIVQGLDKALQLPRVFVNLYGKKQTKPYRKMGHATILGHSTEEALEKARLVKATIKIIS